VSYVLSSSENLDRSRNLLPLTDHGHLVVPCPRCEADHFGNKTSSAAQKLLTEANTGSTRDRPEYLFKKNKLIQGIWECCFNWWGYVTYELIFLVLYLCCALKFASTIISQYFCDNYASRVSSVDQYSQPLMKQNVTLIMLSAVHTSSQPTEDVNISTVCTLRAEDVGYVPWGFKSFG
jgi:hypothetical protein